MTDQKRDFSSSKEPTAIASPELNDPAPRRDVHGSHAKRGGSTAVGSLVVHEHGPSGLDAESIEGASKIAEDGLAQPISHDSTTASTRSARPSSSSMGRVFSAQLLTSALTPASLEHVEERDRVCMHLRALDE